MGSYEDMQLRQNLTWRILGILIILSITGLVALGITRGLEVATKNQASYEKNRLACIEANGSWLPIAGVPGGSCVFPQADPS